MKEGERCWQTQKSNTRGAVMVEFIVAFVPLLMAFFSLVQIAFLYTGQLIVQHAANSAARTASVILGTNGNTPAGVEGGNCDGTALDVARAARAAMRPWLVYHKEAPFSKWPTIITDVKDGKTSATVVATFNCNVPLGNVLVCGSDQERELMASATLPTQTAKYDCAP